MLLLSVGVLLLASAERWSPSAVSAERSCLSTVASECRNSSARDRHSSFGPAVRSSLSGVRYCGSLPTPSLAWFARYPPPLVGAPLVLRLICRVPIHLGIAGAVLLRVAVSGSRACPFDSPGRFLSWFDCSGVGVFVFRLLAVALALGLFLDRGCPTSRLGSRPSSWSGIPSLGFIFALWSFVSWRRSLEGGFCLVRSEESRPSRSVWSRSSVSFAPLAFPSFFASLPRCLRRHRARNGGPWLAWSSARPAWSWPLSVWAVRPWLVSSVSGLASSGAADSPAASLFFSSSFFPFAPVFLGSPFCADGRILGTIGFGSSLSPIDSWHRGPHRLPCVACLTLFRVVCPRFGFCAIVPFRFVGWLGSAGRFVHFVGALRRAILARLVFRRQPRPIRPVVVSLGFARLPFDFCRSFSRRRFPTWPCRSMIHQPDLYRRQRPTSAGRPLTGCLTRVCRPWAWRP